MRKGKLLVLFFLCFCAFQVFAQEPITVTGQVKDEMGNPMPGVSVKSKTGKTGSTTDNNGKFSLKLPAAANALEFSFVGYAPRTIKVSASAPMNVVLNPEDKQGLNEVVVIGGQTQSKRLTSASIITISGKDFENIPSPSVDNLLQGRVAGMNVQISSGEPGVAPTMVVRGNSRLNTNIGDANVAQAQAMSGPLYVIDGIPVNPEDIANSIDATGTNYLAGINVNDIESVDVQKDAAATAAWGSRGANGVIYIKTKRGRSGKPEFKVNVYGGVVMEPQLLNTYTGAEERRQKMAIINEYANYGNLQTIPQVLTDNLNPFFNNATDWQGLFYRSGSIKNIDATVSAANEIVNYRVSMNYFDEKGIIEAFGFNRASLRGNFDFKINPKLRSSLIIGLSRSDRQRGRKYNNSDVNTPVSGATQPASFFRLNSYDSALYTGYLSNLRNKNINDYYNASLELEYKILPDLRFTFLGSANATLSNRDYFLPSTTVESSVAESYKGSYVTYFMSNMLNYSKSITGKKNTHTITGTVTQQFSNDVTSSTLVGGYNTPTNNIQVVSGIPQSDLYGYSGYGSSSMLSFIGQVQYDLNRKYLLYGSYRADASSRFGSNSKWGYFPSVGAGWIVSEEDFMSFAKSTLNLLKIRGSWGISGRQSGDFYAPYNTYVTSGTYNGGLGVQPSYTNGLTKSDLTWARKDQKNIGIEASFLNSRVTVIADIYDNLTKNDYFNFNLPFFTGYNSIEFNAEDLWISNRGVDLTIMAKVLPSRSKLQWNTRVTISHNKNIIAKLPNDNRSFIINDPYGTSRIFAVGQPLYQTFQMEYAGVFNYASQIPYNTFTGKGLTYFKGNHTVRPGDPIWIDHNKDGDVWTDSDNGDQYGDRVPMGNPNPLFTGGFINDFTYKNFSLSLVSVFTFKRDIVNTYFQEQISSVVGGYSSSIFTFANNRLPYLNDVNYWTPTKAAGKTNYSADFPSINPYGPSYYQFIPISSMFNEDGSYFKIKTAIVGYQVPKKFMQRLKLGGARVYGMVDNVLILSKSNVPDPEAVDQLGTYTGGLYPVPRKVTLGIDIQF